MSNQNLKNKSIDELREMKAKGEAEIKRLEHKSKYYDSQMKLLTRKERTHRLCIRGTRKNLMPKENCFKRQKTVVPNLTDYSSVFMKTL